MPTRPRPSQLPARLAAISAHRGGREAAPAGTWEAFRAAVETGAEYVEFDVRRTADRVWVIHHDEHAGPRRSPVAELSYSRLCAEAGRTVPKAVDVMEYMAGRAFGHVDLKCGGTEAEIIGASVDILGADGFVATTEDPASIERMKSLVPGVRTGLSIRRWVRNGRRPTAARREAREFDVRWIRETGTDWVALDHRIASREVLRQCRRNGLGVMLWTVNGPAAITRGLTDGGVDVLVTDRPGYAWWVRDELARSRVGGAPTWSRVPSGRC